MSDKLAGDAEKALGNEAYKNRQFESAIEHYEKAWELNKDITYLNNLAGKLIHPSSLSLSLVRACFSSPHLVWGEGGRAYARSDNCRIAIG